MLASELNFGIPNIDLPWSSEGSVNPSCFAGHQLLMLFLPAGEREHAAEFESYERIADDLSGTDAWLLVIGPEQAASLNNRKIPIALDRDGKAWRAFQKLAKDVRLDRPEGAVFLFTRGGAFHRVWPGTGHSSEISQELRSRG